MFAVAFNFSLPAESTAIGFELSWDKFSMTIWLFLSPESFDESRNFTTGPELTDLESKSTREARLAEEMSTPRPQVSKVAPWMRFAKPPAAEKAV